MVGVLVGVMVYAEAAMVYTEAAMVHTEAAMVYAVHRKHGQ